MFNGITPFVEYLIHETRELIVISGRCEVESPSSPPVSNKSLTVSSEVDDFGSRRDETKEVDVDLWQVVVIPRTIKQDLDFFVPRDAASPLRKTQLDQYLAEKKATLVVAKVKSLFGIFQTASGFVLVAVTGADVVTHIQQHPIFAVRDHILIPIVYKSRLTMDETRCRNFIARSDLNNNTFFSYHYPLFRNWQSLLLQREQWEENIAQGSLDWSDNAYRYLWNAHALSPLMHCLHQKMLRKEVQTVAVLQKLVVPFICGYVGQFSMAIPTESLPDSLSSNNINATIFLKEHDEPAEEPAQMQTEVEAKEVEVSVSDNQHSNVAQPISPKEPHTTPSPSLQYILIARRCIHFAGTRYLRRGMNETGQVANEIETEQLLVREDLTTTSNENFSVDSARRHAQVTAYVQFRGSIPLYWQHINLLSPVPPIAVQQLPASTEEVDKSYPHWDRLERTYGKCIHVVNLLRQSASHREGVLFQAFQTLCSKIATNTSYRRIDYAEFDLLRDGKQHLQDLIDTLTQMVYETGICSLQPQNSSSEEEKIEFGDHPLLQHGIIRTNCVDCLDRTNLSQFLAARVALQLQLEALQLNQSDTTNTEISSSPNPNLPATFLAQLQSKMLRLWTEHGDRIAKQYAGSSAMHRMQEKAEQNQKIKSNSNQGTTNDGEAEDINDTLEISTLLSTTTSMPILVGELVTESLVDSEPVVSEQPLPYESTEFPPAFVVHSSFSGEASPNPFAEGGNREEDDNEANRAAASSMSSTAHSRTSPVSMNPSEQTKLDSAISTDMPSSKSNSSNVIDASKLSVVSDLASNAMISIQRYFLTVSSDFERQYAFDYLLGNFETKGTSRKDVAISDIWRKSPYPENNRSVVHNSAIQQAMELIHAVQATNCT
jgi:hypothetical protein